MIEKLRVVLFACAVVIYGAVIWATATAQGQNNGPVPHTAPATQYAVHAKPTNLKALPKDISSDDLDKLMRAYNQYLGVPCGYCHEEDPETKALDYASDENPSKDTARFMITMTADINSKYLTKLGDRRYADPITCGNCHRGQVQPPNFELKGIL